MSQAFGNELPRRHRQTAHRRSTRYVVVIDAGGAPVARLCLDDRTSVAELDAGTEEVAGLIRGLSATVGATGPEWDRALESHSAAERAAAAVYRLEL